MKIIICDDDETARALPMSNALKDALPEVEVVWCFDVPTSIEKLTTTADVVLASIDHDYCDDPYINGIRVRPT